MTSKRSICLTLSSLIIASLLFILSVIILVSSIIFYLRIRSEGGTTRLGFSIPPYPSAAILKPSGYNPVTVKSIAISNDNYDEYNSVAVSFYEASCSLVHSTVRRVLPDQYRVLQPLGDKRAAFNYNYGNLPVYVAGGRSKITYQISASNKPLNPTMPCTLELFLFDNETNYLRFTRTPTVLPGRGYTNRSGCLSVGIDDEELNSTVIFELPKPNSYYVAVSIAEDVYITAVISVEAVQYNITDTELLPCILDYQTNHCVINIGIRRHIFGIHQTQSEPACIWARATPASIDMVTRVNVTTNPNNDVGKFYKTTVIVSSVVLFVLVCVILIIGISIRTAWAVFNHRKHGIIVVQTEEKQPLLIQHKA